MEPYGDQTGHEHVAQFYGSNDDWLVRSVARFLTDGIRRGDQALIIADRSRGPRIERALRLCAGVDEGGALPLTVLDAQQTLDSLSDRGLPDDARFHDTVSSTVRRLAAASGGAGVSAYGEMAGSLWKANAYPATIRLERLWNELFEREPLRLFCSYPIDVLNAEFDADILDPVLCAHDGLVSADRSRVLEAALSRALDDVLGPVRLHFDATKRPVPEFSTALPPVEETILRLRRIAPDCADEVLALTKRYCTSA
ncbi:MAG: MEDS domain-containing protein [Candidatus Tyrphobacter sp.]